MAQFEAFDDGVEVNGQTVLSVVDGVPDVFEEKALGLLADHGIESPAPDEWYPQQDWLDTFREIDERIGDATMNQIGRSIPRNADWPPGVDSVVGGLESINEAYHVNHRGGEIGYYRAERIDDTTVHVRCKNPYACSFDEGMVKSVADEFTDGVTFVDEISGHCRAEGGEECIYEVSWWNMG